MNFSTSKITSKKVRGSHVDFSTSEIISQNVRGNQVDFSTSEITLKRVRGNHVDFSTIEITSKKICGNHVDFSTIEITSKKYAEMTWKFVEIWSSTYRRNIHVESTCIRRGVPVRLFSLKDRSIHPSYVIYKVTRSCCETYIEETIRNTLISWEEHNDPINKSEPAKHLKNNFHHVFNWVTLCKALQNYKGRHNLEASYIASLKPTLNEQKDFEILTLFRNSVT